MIGRRPSLPMSAAVDDDAMLLMDDDFFAFKDDTPELAASTMALPLPVPLAMDPMHALLLEDADDAFMDAFTESAAGDATELLRGTLDYDHDHPGAYSPAPTDDLSDALTDAASEAASPAPSSSCDDDRWAPASPSACMTAAATVPSRNTADSVTIKTAPPSPPMSAQPRPQPQLHQQPHLPLLQQQQLPLASMAAAMLPFAFPVAACFPPTNLNQNQKRPLPDVLPSAPPSAQDASMHKKSKREIRQMKNRESANRSRLRRKEKLTEMSSEVDELLKTQHELQNTIAALRAENKSLHDQNAFLRSLVTTYSVPARMVPSPLQQQPQQPMALPDLESGRSHSHSQNRAAQILDQSDGDEDEDEDVNLDNESMKLVMGQSATKKTKTSRRSAATLSAASLGLCASVFGLTILTDVDNGAAQSSHIRRAGRVLHTLPATANSACSPQPGQTFLQWVGELLGSSWAMLSTSPLAYGVFLNVVSFVVIMGLYHFYQNHWGSRATFSSKKVFRWADASSLRAATHSLTRRGGGNGSSSSVSSSSKRRSVSWQDVRLHQAQQSSPLPAHTLS